MKLLQSLAKTIMQLKKNIHKVEQTGRLENQPGPGGLKRLTAKEIRFVAKTVRQDPTTGAVNISQGLRSTGTEVGPSTIRRTLHDNGLFGTVLRKKPLISKINQQRQLET